MKSSNVTSVGDNDDDDGRIYTKVTSFQLHQVNVKTVCTLNSWTCYSSLWIYRTFIKYICRTFVNINICTRLITDWQHDASHLPHRNLCSSEQPNNKVLNRGRDDCVVVQVNKWLSTVTTTLHINLMYEQRACFDNPQMNGYRHSTLLITWRFGFQLDWCH